MKRVHNQAVHHPYGTIDRTIHISESRQNFARLSVVKKAKVQRLYVGIEAGFEIQPHVDTHITRKISAQQICESQSRREHSTQN